MRIVRAALAGGCSVFLAIATPLAAQVTGSVVNGTTGRPAAGATLTLSSFRGGMTPIEETVSGADGRFAFTKQLPSVSRDQPYAGAIRAEFEGIGYTEVLMSEALGQEVEVTVYTASAANLPSPSIRALILEPAAGELVVRDSYQFLTDSQPPVTYSSEDGTLRFHALGEPNQEIDVSCMGPAGMRLRNTALPAGEPGLYKVDFPLKPGRNQIDLTYAVPYEDGMQYSVRSAYPGQLTRVASPEGVQITGPGLTSLGIEPRSKLPLYEYSASEIALTISGEGRLPAPAPSAPSGQSEISIQPAPIASELAWIMVLAGLIFCIGFFHLLGSKLPEGHAGARREKG